MPNAGGCQERWNINGKTNDSDMKVKTCAETVDIRRGARFVEMRIAGVPFMGMSVMEALSEPEVEVRADGSRYYSWQARNLETGNVVNYGVCDEALGYAPKLYDISSPLVAAWLRKRGYSFSDEEGEMLSTDAGREETRAADTVVPAAEDDMCGKDAKSAAVESVPQKQETQPGADKDEYRDIGCGVVSLLGDGSFTLLNMATGKRRMFVSESGRVLVDDSEIDVESIHRRFKHCGCVDDRYVRYWFGRYSDFKEGFCALAWTIYPDGQYFADEDGFGGEDNDEEQIYCIINTNLDIVVPFRPMDDVKEELRRVVLRAKQNEDGF